MRFVIFCLIISFCLCDETHYFRYKDGTFTKGNRIPRNISGSLYYTKSSEGVLVQFVGMEYPTMIPLRLMVGTIGATTTGMEIKLNCMGVEYELETIKELSGRSVLSGSWDKSKFEAECFTKTGDPWTFNSSNVMSKTMHYSQNEAGLRAKFLIDQPTSKYKSHHVVLFATTDYPYFSGDCGSYLTSMYPDAPGPEPGAIIAGKDGKHCAILDNEGTKFIQSNSVTKKVTYDSIALTQRYFPSGVVYKRYPKE